jgi:hypothetical protein
MPVIEGASQDYLHILRIHAGSGADPDVPLLLSRHTTLGMGVGIGIAHVGKKANALDLVEVGSGGSRG